MLVAFEMYCASWMYNARQWPILRAYYNHIHFLVTCMMLIFMSAIGRERISEWAPFLFMSCVNNACANFASQPVSYLKYELAYKHATKHKLLKVFQGFKCL